MNEKKAYIIDLIEWICWAIAGITLCYFGVHPVIAFAGSFLALLLIISIPILIGAFLRTDETED